MKLTISDIKALINNIGFIPEDGANNIFYKQFSKYNNYCIRINFNTKKIEYRSQELKDGEGIQLGDKTTSNFASSENFVVLECVNRLLEIGYPPSNLVLEKSYPLGRKLKGKLDIIVFDDDKKAYLMIECKTWGAEYEKEYRKMIQDGGQLFSYYANDRAAKFLCLYASCFNDHQIEYRNDIIPVHEEWKELANVDEIHDHWNKNYKDNGIFEEGTAAYNIEVKALTRGRLKPLTKDDSGRIFNQFAEILRHNVVSDKPNAFNKILNLFICKIIDEDKNDSEQVDFQWLENDTDESLQVRLNDLYKKGMHRFLEIDVTDFTNEEITDKLTDINDKSALEAIKNMLTKLRLQKNPEFAFIEVYNDQSFKTNACIVREVVELLQPYQFRYGHKQQFLGDFFELLLNTSIKQEAGQFFTPVPITRFIVSSLPLENFILEKLKTDEPDILPAVIDFACGTGHFLTEYMDKVQSIIENLDIEEAKPSAKKKLAVWREYDKYDWAKEYVYGIDADYRLVKSSKVSSFLNGDGEANIIRANGLDHFKLSNEFRGRLKESLESNPQDNSQFDVLIANPPYSVSAFKSTVKNGDESFELFRRLTDNSSEIECLFIERAKQLLKTGGYAGIVLPSSILSNAGVYSGAREVILKYFKVIAITEFGPNTFMATGTNTVVLFLERRPNNDSTIIKNAIDDFFERPKDTTILGLEKAFSKYVSNVYSQISIEDYISFVQKKTNEKFANLEIWDNYQAWFNGLTEVTLLQTKKQYQMKGKDEQKQILEKLFYEKVTLIEKEKLLYFILTYTQRTVVVKVGEKKDEKDFLGYEFSNRRGHEGIKMLSNGTRLYDEENPDNPEKASSYVLHAFLNDLLPIDKSVKENIAVFDTVSLLNFEGVAFNKDLITSRPMASSIKSKHPIVRLGDLCALVSGQSPKSEFYNTTGDGTPFYQGKSEFGSVYLNAATVWTQNITKESIKNDILMSVRAPVGPVNLNPFDKICIGRGLCAIRVNNKINNEFLFQFLKYNQNLIYGNDGAIFQSISQKQILDIKVPLPSLEIQKKILTDIDIITKFEKECKGKIGKFHSIIQKKLIEKITGASKNEKLKKIAHMNPPKPNYADYDSELMVSFIEMASVSEAGYIKKTELRKFGDVIKKGYTYFANNDIIVAKITPCMENGKCALVDGLKNELGFGSTEFHTIRAKDNTILPKFLFLLLNREEVRQTAKNKMTGKSGHRRVPATFYLELEIPIIPISEQEDFVSEIKQIESKIFSLEEKLATTDMEKEQVLLKYL